VAQYVIYFLVGYVELWLVVVPLGVSSGFAAPWPYYALLGSLALLVFATPLVGFSEKCAALVAIISSVMFLLWPTVGMIKENVSPEEAWFPVAVAAVPTGIIIHAGIRLYKRRSASWWTPRSQRFGTWRYPMAAAPLLLLALTSNVRYMLWLVLNGPP
jgi:hypothetical protein